MKKNYLFGMALMASLAFFSCTNEVVYVHDGESSEQVSDEQIITLQVSNGGDGLTTRAGRPLYSSEAKQTIDYVRLWIFDASGNLEYSTTFDEWDDNDSKVYGTSVTTAHGREAKITLSGTNKLETGEGKTYNVYAIGYHFDGGYTGIPNETGVNESQVKNVKLTYSGNDNAEEIFAGSLEINLTSATSTGFNKTIVLNRQVAGAFVYLKDIPYFDDAATLELVASSTNNQLVLGQFANTDFGSNGNNTVSLNVINGWNNEDSWTIGKAKETIIAKITLSEWFTSITNNNGLINVNNWKNKYDPNNTQEGNPTFQKGSVFAGTFLIPFSKVDGTQTLKLVMKAGQTSSYQVLASWNINLSATGNNYTNLYTWNGSTFAASTTEGLNINSYSIVRNHLYGIGTRMEDDPGNGTDPEEPDPDDEPESLNNKQELTLRVNDNWEVIHDMVLD